MKRAIITTCVAILVSSGAAAAPAQAQNGCVTHNEFDNMTWGLTTEQVSNRWETNGWFIDVTDNYFKRGYDACWAEDRKVVVWYDLDLGLSDHWDVRGR